MESQTTTSNKILKKEGRTSDDTSVEINLSRVRIQYLLLLAFILFGFYLRSYHLDFPSIGYHNMKENEYISEAIFFNYDGDYLHRRTFNFWGLEDGPGYFEEYAQPPLVPYMTVFFWNIFGEHLWIPRLIVMMFMLASIPVMYALVKRLSNSEYLALLSAFLLTIMPLGVYFGRNVQPEAPAMFCILLALYFFVRWKDEQHNKDLLYTLLAFSAAGLFKITFLIAGVICMLLFPYAQMIERFQKKRNEFMKTVKYALAGVLPFVIIQSIFEFTIVDPTKKNLGSISELLNIFDPMYWTRIWPGLSSYINDNYTWWFFWLAVIGLVLVVMRKKTPFTRFVGAYALSLPVYIMIVSGKLGGHSYYQMPFLPLVVMLSAYTIITVGMLLKSVVKIQYIEYAALLILLLTLSPVTAANDRVWNTIFFGQDIMGEYIKEHTTPGERFFNLGHSQTQAVCTYARRRCGDFNTVTQLIELEKKFNIRFLHSDTYSWANLQNNKEVVEYITQNYKIRLIGGIPQNNQLTMIDILLERGGTINFTALHAIQPRLAKVYDTKQGDVQYYILENP